MDQGQDKEVTAMKQYHGHPEYYKMTQEEMLLHSQKNKDYAQGGDPLGNFKRVSAVLRVWGFDIPPELVCLIYMLKQLDCAMWMLSQGYEGEVETFDKRVQDVHVYAKLARVLRQESTTGQVVSPAGTLCSKCKKRPAALGHKRCALCNTRDRENRQASKEKANAFYGQEYCSHCRAPLIDEEKGKCSACLAS